MLAAAVDSIHTDPCLKCLKIPFNILQNIARSKSRCKFLIPDRDRGCATMLLKINLYPSCIYKYVCSKKALKLCKNVMESSPSSTDSNKHLSLVSNVRFKLRAAPPLHHQRSPCQERPKSACWYFQGHLHHKSIQHDR